MAHSRYRASHKLKQYWTSGAMGQTAVRRYYVYQEVKQHRVRIHVGKCGHCNDGRGKVYSGRPRVTGKWYGPYDYDEACRVAEGLGVPDTKPCQHCMP
jgi:hypothetical protein